LGAGRPKGLNMILPKLARVTYIYPAIVWFWVLIKGVK
jgi:hypothetical protein